MAVMDDDNGPPATADERAVAYAEQLRRRMFMARIHAFGTDRLKNGISQLRETLIAQGTNWSEEKLGDMQRGHTSRKTPRVITADEAAAIAKACGLPVTFFHIDLAELEEPGLKLEVSRLRADLDELRADLDELARMRVQLSAELQELRDQRQSEESTEGAP
jgi:hypothetical protein